MVLGMEALITTGEAADRVGVNRATIVRWVRAGKLRPARTLPGRGGHLFRVADLDALRAETQQAASWFAPREARTP